MNRMKSYHILLIRVSCVIEVKWFFQFLCPCSSKLNRKVAILLLLRFSSEKISRVVSPSRDLLFSFRSELWWV